VPYSDFLFTGSLLQYMWETSEMLFLFKRRQRQGHHLLYYRIVEDVDRIF
jgi:hypothetical protein